MMYSGNPLYLPDLLPLEPPDDVGRSPAEPDEDMLYEEWRDEQCG